MTKKINKIDKPLARLAKIKREGTQVNNIRYTIENTTIDPATIKMIEREYYKKLCTHRFNNLKEMDQFL